MFDFQIDHYPLFLYLFRFILLIILICLLPFIFKESIKTNIRNKKSLFISIFIVLLFLFYAAEIFFTFYAETNGVNDTYCSKTWNYRYWRLNNNGFRDIEFEPLINNNKPKLVFIGDSYTEGHGIKNPEDRVSNIIRRKIPDYAVFNLGKCGMGIKDEMQVLYNLPFVPKIVIMQTCSNDWDYLIKSPKALSAIPNILLSKTDNKFFTKYSITFNYLNANLMNILDKLIRHRLSDNQVTKIYTAFGIQKTDYINSRYVEDVFKYCYENSDLPYKTIQTKVFDLFKEYNPNLKVMTDSVLFSNYINKLNEIQRFCKQTNTLFVVVPYPDFDKFNFSITSGVVLSYLCTTISDRGIYTLNIYPALKRANLKSYTVNRHDNHVNVEASKIIADTLDVYLKQFTSKHSVVN